MPLTPLPHFLAEIAKGRGHINTAEYGCVTSHASQTIRKTYHLTGECFGIRPVKVGRRLLWPVSEIAKLFNGEVLK